MPHGRIADRVLGRRRDHLDHQRDDVARRAELAVLPGGGDLAEHVLVEVALGVAILHRDLVEQVDDLGSSAGVGMVKRASFMWRGMRRAVAAQRRAGTGRRARRRS